MKQVCKLTKVLALGLVILVATACASSGTAPAPTATKPPSGGGTQTGNVSVDIRGFAFSPATLSVAKGTIVTWTNNDSVAHTVTATDPAGAFDSGNMRNGATFSFTFNSEGPFNYRCNIHPSMRGTVLVGVGEAPRPTEGQTGY